MLTIGFPRMHKELNEKRDFLPSFFKALSGTDCRIFLENGYGNGLGFSKNDYLYNNPDILFTDNISCYNKDIVVVLRSPEFDEIELMRHGSILISMLHFETRKKRRELLKAKGIFAISLDSIKNDSNERIVVNYDGTASYGISAAFDELFKSMPNYLNKNRDVIYVSIIGMGMIGYKAAHAARIYGSNELNAKMVLNDTKGVLIKMIPKNITRDCTEMKKILKETDILVDASTRENPCEYIIRNEQLNWMKASSVILDLTADPYLLDMTPIQVKGIEGIPTGTLDKYIFHADDPIYTTLPKGVNTTNRRTVVSCNAWPGVKPLDCMEIYGKQLLPILKKVLNCDIKTCTIDDDDFYLRAIQRATLSFFENEKNISSRKSVNKDFFLGEACLTKNEA